MAKGPKDNDEGAPLPGLDELMHGPKEEPKPLPVAELPDPDDDLSGPLPQPGDAPKPAGVKVRVKAGAAPPGPGAIKKGKPPGPKQGALTKAKDYSKDKLWFLFPPDPVEKMRVKLRILGLIKFLIAPTVIMTLVSLLMMFVWYTFWDYGATIAVLSHEILTIIILIPAGLGLFMAVYLPLVLILLNRYEDRWNRVLRDMLRKNIKFKFDRPGTVKTAKPKTETKRPKVPEPEEPLPQPTVQATEI